MFQNYLITGLRNFKRNALTSWLNILGLAISLSACLVIFIYVKRELSFDRGHPDAERIYRLTQVINSGGHVENSSSCPFPTMPALYEDHGHLIENYVRIFDFQIPVKSFKLEDERLFNERGIFYTDSTVFNMWDIPLIQGNPNDVLDRPFTMVISKDLAIKYFGDTDPVGQVIMLAGQDQLRCEITGVMGEGTASHFQPQAVISISTATKVAPFITQNWVWNPCWTYIKLRPEVAPEDLGAHFPDFVQAHYPQFNRDMITHELHPIADIHLRSHLEFEMSQNSDMNYVYIFISCGILLLIIAAINFINLTTVNLIARTRELGMRKVLGADRTKVMLQVLTESVLTACIAALIAFSMLGLAQPLLNDYLALDIGFNAWLNPWMLGGLLIAILFVGLLAGLYPALRFSRASTVGVLRGHSLRAPSGNWFRKALVVVQFSIASLLIIFTISSKRQLDYMQGMDKGYDTGNIVVFDIMTTPIPGRLAAFKTALKEHAAVKHVTVMNELLGVNNNNHEFNHEGMAPGEWKYFPALEVDEDFVRTFGIELIAGRDYESTREKEDSTSLVINKSMAQLLGYNPEEALGKRLNSMTGQERIVGVTADFHYKSLHHPVGPFVLDIAQRPGQFHYFAQHMAVSVDDMNPEVAAHMQAVWEEFVQNKPFEYHLLEDVIDQLYGGEYRLSRLLSIFSMLAVLIACMGLFALTWFIARLKMREIAIRKTLGAGMMHLISIATREQMTMVGLSFIIGFPLAFWVINRWLESFAFRMTQGMIPYIVSALCALAIAFLTMLVIAYGTANRNPAEVLKTE